MNITNIIESIRPCGQVICSLYHGREIKDPKSCLSTLGLDKAGLSVCSEIGLADAKTIIKNALQNHIWTNEPILPSDKAEAAADMFLSALKGRYRLYTNDKWGDIEPISDSFIDQGVIAITEEGVIGILWVIDNDQP